MPIKDKKTLKSYFENGDVPTENQFIDLIDSLKHEASTSQEELVKLANSLATIENEFIHYSVSSISGNQVFELVVSQEGKDDQVIEMGDTYGQLKKQYFLGDGPFVVRVKNFPSEGLDKKEYYILSFQTGLDNISTMLFGNSLPGINGFEFGEVEGKRFFIQIYKTNISQENEIKVIHTNIKFINKTNASIQYRVQSGNWGGVYKAGNSITNHYDAWDYLSFFYRSDMTNEDKTIVCKIYNDDTSELLVSRYLTAGVDNQNVHGDEVDEIRNVRIECDYVSYVSK